MADIELVIKIDGKYLKNIKECVKNGDIDYEPWVAIANGTVLPEQHGDLIDRDELLKNDVGKIMGFRESDIINAPTILEASEVEE